MKKPSIAILKNQFSTLTSSKLPSSKITKKGQRQIKGGSGDSIIIEEDMII